MATSSMEGGPPASGRRLPTAPLGVDPGPAVGAGGHGPDGRHPPEARGHFSAQLHAGHGTVEEPQEPSHRRRGAAYLHRATARTEPSEHREPAVVDEAEPGEVHHRDLGAAVDVEELCEAG